MKKVFTDPLLNEMFKTREGLCVSILVPLYKISPERSQNPARVKNAVEHARDQLKKILTKDKKQAASINKINDSITMLFNKIDFIHNGKGVGIFVSSAVTHLVYFPFTVSEKIVIGDSFETRDMLYKEHYLAEYLVLALSFNSAQLFIGKDGWHTEVKDKNFPKKYTDDFIYEKPSPGSPSSPSLKSTEKDTSITKQIRMKDFYRSVDKSVSEYLTEETPLIISGVAKCLSSFLEITAHQRKIIAQISGNYSDAKKEYFELKTWKKVLRHQQDVETALIKELNDKIKSKQLVIGLKEAWKSAELGKGLRLVVEKDFRQAGFQKEGDVKITTHPPQPENFKVMEDAVDDLIELVLEKGGNVTFVKNGALKKMQKVALITRY